MTAIAGIVQFDGKPLNNAVPERMQAVLQPYGCDAQHQWRSPCAALIRTLLRITPEDGRDRQPLLDRESNRLVIFDGRLDNRDELAAAIGLSHQAVGLMADSELAFHACLRWDTKAVEHLLGDFALASWQPRQRRLWLARDPLGRRPLFWHQQADFFAFGSLPKALLVIPNVPRKLCEERLAGYLALLPIIGPESFFKDIYRVEPGRLLVLEDRQISVRRYHHFNTDGEIQLASDEQYLEAFREHLERAVACRLRSAGPIASQLSSGFDSSTVTAVAARQLAARGQGLLAYTAVPRDGFDGPVRGHQHGDEGPAASALAARFDNIEHILIHSDGTTPIDNLQQDTEWLDRGPLNPCNLVWGNAIRADARRRGVRALLTGQMGNMSISYPGEQYLPSLLRRGRLATWWREASALKGTQARLRWPGLVRMSLGPHLPASLWSSINRLQGRGNRRLSDYTAIHPAFLARMGGETALAKATGWDLSYRPWGDGRRMRIAGIERVDNADHAVVANLSGLETRDSTSDLRLLEFCLAVPDHQYLRNGQTRWLLRRLMGDVLPPEILNAKTKGLQAADWYESTGTALPRIREELSKMVQHGVVGEYLDLEALQQSVEDWPDGGWASERVFRTYRLKLLRGLSVGTFIRYVEEGNRWADGTAES